jgi:hypothetical protein
MKKNNKITQLPNPYMILKTIKPGIVSFWDKSITWWYYSYTDIPLVGRIIPYLLRLIVFSTIFLIIIAFIFFYSWAFFTFITAVFLLFFMYQKYIQYYNVGKCYFPFEKKKRKKVKFRRDKKRKLSKTEKKIIKENSRKKGRWNIQSSIDKLIRAELTGKDTVDSKSEELIKTSTGINKKEKVFGPKVEIKNKKTIINGAALQRKVNKDKPLKYSEYLAKKTEKRTKNKLKKIPKI